MKTLSIPLLLGVLLATGPVCAQENISKVNGSIHAEAGQQYRDLETVNGSIKVAEGVQARQIETVNGSVTLGDRVHAHSVETVNGDIRLGRDVVITDDLESVNGSVFTDQGSRIGGSIETVNGNIGLVRTELARGIETINGDITVGIGSHVRGGVKVRKAKVNLSLTPQRKQRVIVGPGAVVDGPLDFEREVVLYVHATAKVGPISGATAQRYETDTAPRD